MLSCIHREPDSESGSPADLALDEDPAVVLQNEAVCNRHPEAGSGLLGHEKRFVNLVQVFLRYPDSRITDRDFNHPVFSGLL